MGLYQSGGTWVCISHMTHRPISQVVLWVCIGQVVHGSVSVRWYMGLYRSSGTWVCISQVVHGFVLVR